MNLKKILIVFFTAVCIAVLLCGGLSIKRYRERTALTRLLDRLETETEVYEPVTVAVIDSGLEIDKINSDRIAEGGYDFVGDAEMLSDAYGHGTLISSLILGNTPESVKILPLRVTDGEGNADIEVVCRALDYAAEQGTDIVNISLNTAILPGEEDLGKLGEVVQNLREQGILVVVSAGNMGNDVKHFLPACLEETIVVSAVDGAMLPYDFSNYGATVDFCSFGEYAGGKGTSFAAGYVTSVLARLKSYGREDGEGLLKKCAIPALRWGKSRRYAPYFGDGCVWTESFVKDAGEIGLSEADGSTFLCRAPDAYNLGMDILDMKWEEMAPEELEKYLLGTDEEYVGMFLTTLGQEDYAKLEECEPILHSNYTSGRMERTEDENCYETVKKQTYDYAEFCKEKYLKQREKLKTSAWLFQDDKATFWLRCGDSFAQYSITGLKDGSIDEPQTRVSGGLDWGCLENGRGDMEMPGINRISFYVAGIAAYKTEYGYRSNGVLALRDELTDWHTEYLDSPENDTGTAFYGINIQFSGYHYSRMGYHLSSKHVYTYYRGSYDPNTKTGTAAYTYNHAYNKYGDYVFGQTGTYVGPKDFCFKEQLDSNFNQLLQGLTTVVTHVDGRREELPFLVSRVGSEDGFSNDSNGLIEMNCENMHFPGTVLYDSNLGVTTVETDPTEYVIMPVAETYAVRVNANGGTINNNYPEGGGSSTTSRFPVTYDTNLYDNIGGLGVSRDGYIFLGWYKDDESKIYDSSGVAVTSVCWSSDHLWRMDFDDYKAYDRGGVNLNLYAHWQAHDYAVRVNANGGIITNNYPENPGTMGHRSLTSRFQVTYNSNLYDRIGGLNVEREGYRFLGWYTGDGEKIYDDKGVAVRRTSCWNANGKWQKTFADYKAFSEGRTNLELHAEWEPDTYAIKLNANGGMITNDYLEYPATEGVHSTTSYYPVEFDSTKNNSIGALGMERVGYQFTGWYTDPVVGERVYNENGVAVRNGSYWNGEGKWKKAFEYSDTYSRGVINLMLYAHWKPIQYKIHFDGNYATSGSMADMDCTYDQTFSLPANQYQRTGYIFDGWSTVRDGVKVYEDGQQNLKNLTANSDNVITLYARWKDVKPPVIKENTDISVIPKDPASTQSDIYYGWTNRTISIRFSAEDDGSGMDSLKLYEGRGTGGAVLASSVDLISYAVSLEGEFNFTLVAKDRSGNSTVVYVTTRIDYTTPRGTLAVSYDGYNMEILVSQIVEENERYSGNKASGCKEAWAVLKGIDDKGHVVVLEQKTLGLKTPGNIYTGAAFGGCYSLNDQFNFESEIIRVEVYLRDNAGNDSPMVGTETVYAFWLEGEVKRDLGAAECWKKGEAGTVYFTTAAFVDRVKLEYPAAWIEADQGNAFHGTQNLAERGFDFTYNKSYAKNETDSFYIPLYAVDGQFTIVIHAWKGGHEKRVELPVRSAGTVLGEIRTRLR